MEDSTGDPIETLGIATEKKAVSGPGKGPIPLQHKMVTTIWCMFGSP